MKSYICHMYFFMPGVAVVREGYTPLKFTGRQNNAGAAYGDEQSSCPGPVCIQNVNN